MTFIRHKKADRLTISKRDLDEGFIGLKKDSRRSSLHIKNYAKFVTRIFFR